MNSVKYILLIITVAFFSCRNRQKESDKILEEFKKVNASLDSITSKVDSNGNQVGGFKAIGSVFGNGSSIYDSLELKFAGTAQLPLILRMRREMREFYDYMSELRRRFYVFCGDKTGDSLPAASENNTTLTRDFFFHTEPATYLWSYLLTAKKSLHDNTSSEKIREELRKIAPLGDGSNRSSSGGYTTEQWRNKYLKDMPPIAALTFINAIEGQIKNTEAKILFDYIKQ